MGGCIGSSYCLSMCRLAPDRVSAAVLQNPIGLSEDNGDKFLAMFDQWGEEIRTGRDDVAAEALQSMRHNMFDGDFVFSVGRDFVATCPVPLLVLAGNDDFHPRAVAEEIAALAPNAELMVQWSGPERHEATLARVRGFLLSHTPDRLAE